MFFMQTYPEHSLKPSKNLSVLPLINPETKEVKARTPVGLSGKEKETVVVFKRVIPLLLRAVVASMVVIAISLHPLL